MRKFQWFEVSLTLGHIVTQDAEALKGARSAFMVNHRFATLER